MPPGKGRPRPTGVEARFGRGMEFLGYADWAIAVANSDREPDLPDPLESVDGLKAFLQQVTYGGERARAGADVPADGLRHRAPWGLRGARLRQGVPRPFPAGQQAVLLAALRQPHPRQRLPSPGAPGAAVRGQVTRAPGCPS